MIHSIFKEKNKLPEKPDCQKDQEPSGNQKNHKSELRILLFISIAFARINENINTVDQLNHVGKGIQLVQT